MSYFHVFDCQAYHHISGDKHKKLDANAEPLVFVGYKVNSKGYRLWDKYSQRTIASTDVIFDEDVFSACPVPPSWSAYIYILLTQSKPGIYLRAFRSTLEPYSASPLSKSFCFLA